MGYEEGVIVTAFVLEQLAGCLTILAALVASIDAWCGVRLTRILYWIAVASVLAGLCLIGFAGGWAMLKSTLFGPPRSDQHGAPIEHLNVVTFWLVLYIGSIPFWLGRPVRALR